MLIPHHTVFSLLAQAGNSCKQSAVLFSRAGQVRVCATANQWVSRLSEPSEENLKHGEQTPICRLLSEFISPQTSAAQWIPDVLQTKVNFRGGGAFFSAQYMHYMYVAGAEKRGISPFRTWQCSKNMERHFLPLMSERRLTHMSAISKMRNRTVYIIHSQCKFAS